MNDSKYGRLYPERAVAPLRKLVEQELTLCQEGGNYDEATAWAGCLASLDELGFPPDEPLFLLRGQDVLAPEIVRAYADEVKREPCDLDAQHILDFADRMEAWEPRKLPD